MENVEDLENLCNQVLEMDPKIRFSAIITDKGKRIAGGYKKGINILVDQKMHEMMFTEVALRTRMRRDFDEQLGPVKYALSRRGKVVTMSFPLGAYILYVSAEEDVDTGRIPNKILKIIQSISTK